MRSFLRTIVGCSEKAASIARACRKEKDLFQLLVEEKTGDQKNANHLHDFKTLADVLIQETVRHDLGRCYPTLAEHILGEESAEFTNTLGEKIRVKVCPTMEETSQLLSRVLDGRQGAADLLAKEVHSDFCFVNFNGVGHELIEQVPEDPFSVENLGIWIDPIDGTNNYIRGQSPSSDDVDYSDSFQTKGLPVVTVLIGVFDRKSGKPVAGVVNQPFVKYDHKENKWQGRVHWGIITPYNVHYSSVAAKESSSKETPKIIVSMNEVHEVHAQLTSLGYDVINAGGAGYKILCVVLGWADLYVTPKPSTYKWDSCAGHAILSSLQNGGGGIVTLTRPNDEIVYQCSNSDAPGIQKFCNDAGLIAFRTVEDLDKFLRLYNGSESSQFLLRKI